MKTAGIVCEYNPLHNGHVYQINKTKEAGATHIVCVMSGNFVQRGDCAVFSKYARAQAAIKCGADIVVELPVAWSCDSAPNFALGSVAILDSLGIDMLSFGSETDDAIALKKAAVASLSEQTGRLLKAKLRDGLSYPAALYNAVCELYGKNTAEVLLSPNSTLAVEYIKALIKLKSSAEVFVCKRKGPGHDDPTESNNLLSASAIRSLEDFALSEDYVPKEAFEIFKEASLQGEGPCNLKYGERAVISALRAMNEEEFGSFVESENGLCQRICAAVHSSTSLEEVFEKAKTKNVTMAKIRRVVMRAFLGIPADMSKVAPPYIKVLASNRKGFEILSKANGKIPIVTKHSDIKKLSSFAQAVYDSQCRASDLYGLFSPKIAPCGLEQKTSMTVIK